MMFPLSMRFRLASRLGFFFVAALVLLACSPQPQPSVEIPPTYAAPTSKVSDSAVAGTVTMESVPTSVPSLATEPEPTPDIPATVTAQVQAILADFPTPVPVPTATPYPTPTPAPTAAPMPTYAPVPRPTNTPTPTTVIVVERKVNPNYLALINGLPWVRDGVTELENYSVKTLRELAIQSPKVLEEVLERERTWLPPKKGIDTHVISAIKILSEIDESIGLRLVDMPFLEVIEVSETGHSNEMDALWQLRDLAETDLEGVRYILSHPSLERGITDENSGEIMSFLLEWKNPAATAEIDKLFLLQDVENTWVGPTPLDYAMELAIWSPNFFQALMEKPWVRDGVSHDEAMIMSSFTTLARTDEALALQVLAMPFLEEITSADSKSLHIIVSYVKQHQGSSTGLLTHPKLVGGITDQKHTTLALIYLEQRFPNAASKVNRLSWIQNGMDQTEEQRALTLLHLREQTTEQLFRAVIEKPWVDDGISKDEESTIRALTMLGSWPHDHEPTALRLLEMPFLQSVQGSDAAAVNSLSWMALNVVGPGGVVVNYLDQVMSYPEMSDGITDREAKIVAVFQVLWSVRPDLMPSLLEPETVSLAERVVWLPLAGETSLAVIQIDTNTAGILDLMEQALRAQEDFMAVPFPNSYVPLLVTDADPERPGGHFNGIITVEPGLETSAHTIAHELAHVYWSGFAPSWLVEGAAELMEEINQGEINSAPTFSSPTCSLASNIFNLRKIELQGQLSGDSDASKKTRDDIYSSRCNYTFGRELYFDLYQQLGNFAFRQGFTRLYLILASATGRSEPFHNDKYYDKCRGPEQGLCYVREAFVTQAAPTDAAVANEIINYWYYGDPLGER